MGDSNGHDGRLIDLYRELAEKSLDIMLLFRFDGSIVHANPAALAAYGYSLEEIKRLKMRDIRAPETLDQFTEQLKQVREGSIRFDTIHRRSDGTKFPVEATWTLAAADGPDTILSLIRDITDKKAVEDALRKSERELSDFFDTAAIGLHWVGPNGKILRANQAELDLLGYSRDEYIGRNIAEFHSDAETIGDILGCLTRGERISERPARLLHKDGSTRDVLITSSVYFDQDGQFGHTRCFTVDVSQRLAAEAALRESELRWKTVTEMLPNLIWSDLPDGTCDWLSSQWEDYTGIPVSEMLQLNWLDMVIHPDDRERTLKCWNDACAGLADYDLEYRIRRYDGEYHWFKTRGVPIRDDSGNIVYWFGTCTDIEDIKVSEAARHRSEATLRAFYANSPIFMGITEVIGDDVFHIYDNPATCRFFGAMPNATANKFAKKQLGADPDVVDLWIKKYHEAEQTGRPVRFEHEHPSADGSRWLSVSVSVLGRSDSGRTRFCYVAEDVTERVTAAQTLRQSEERFRLLVQHSANIIWRTGPDGKYLGPQESFERFTGLPHDEYCHDGGLAAVHADDVEHVINAWTAALTDGEPFEFEYRLRNADGEYRHALARGVPVRDDDGNIREWVGVAQDISDRKVAEVQRAELLKLEAEARQEAEVLNELARSLAGELELNALVQSVTDAATSLTGAGFGAFFYNVLNTSGESYMLYTLSGVPRSAFEKFPMPRNTPIFEPTFRGEGVVRIDDVTKDPRYGTMAPHYGMPKGHLPVHSYLAAPVVSRSGEVLGGLFFGHPEPGMFTESHERMVVGLAAHAAVAMDNARLYAAAQKEIEQRQVAEAELRFARDVLEDTVAERTAELRKLALDLQAEVEVRKGAEARLRQLMTRLVNIQEEERRRIGRNIHDHLGQQLTGLRINLATLESQTADMNGISELARNIQTLAEELDSSIDFVTWELIPGEIATVGLPTALRELVNAWSRRFDIPAEFDFRGASDVQLPEEVSSNLYRITQEALHNIVKHAKASRADVLFEVDGAGVKLIVEDDGDGFEPASDDSRTHSLGLISMRERASALDGTFEIESTPGNGTTIFVRVPLASASLLV
ncbi:MAG: PAS domain S-box protein [Pyrinomonadaceae bacterium]